MKRKKLIIYIPILIVIVFELLLIAAGSGKSNTIYLSSVEPILLNSTCDTASDISDTKAIFFQFCYQRNKYYSIPLLNSHIIHEDFKKQEIESIKIFLEDNQGCSIKINKYLHNAISLEHLHEYINQEFLLLFERDKSEENKAVEIKNQAYERLTEKIQGRNEAGYLEALNILEENCSNNDSLLAKIKQVKQYKIYDERLINKQLSQSFICNKNFSSFLYYVGNIDIFIELYNKDYISIYDKHNFYPGFIMKLRLPENFKGIRWLSLRIQIQFKDNSSINKTYFFN